MRTVTIDEATTSLLQLLADVERGEEVVIARDGMPVARLSPYTSPTIAREAGLWRKYPGWENFVFDPSILAPMSDEEVASEGWE